MNSTPSAPTIRSTSTSPVPSVAAYAAAAGFMVEGVISLVHHTGDRNWDALSQVLDVAYLLACLALVAALPALGRRFGSPVGRYGVIAAQVGYLAMAAESLVSAFAGGNTLGGLFFGGLLLSLAGLLTLAIGALISGRHRWAAPLPFLGMLVATAGGDHGGAIVLAAVWILLGTALLRPEDA